MSKYQSARKSASFTALEGFLTRETREMDRHQMASVLHASLYLEGAERDEVIPRLVERISTSDEPATMAWAVLHAPLPVYVDAFIARHGLKGFLEVASFSPNPCPVNHLHFTRIPHEDLEGILTLLLPLAKSSRNKLFRCLHQACCHADDGAMMSRLMDAAGYSLDEAFEIIVDLRIRAFSYPSMREWEAGILDHALEASHRSADAFLMHACSQADPRSLAIAIARRYPVAEIILQSREEFLSSHNWFAALAEALRSNHRTLHLEARLCKFSTVQLLEMPRPDLNALLCNTPAQPAAS